jgi:hypothetical protein
VLYCGNCNFPLKESVAERERILHHDAHFDGSSRCVYPRPLNPLEWDGRVACCQGLIDRFSHPSGESPGQAFQGKTAVVAGQMDVD